jgi:hypothetical protein
MLRKYMGRQGRERQTYCMLQFLDRKPKILLTYGLWITSITVAAHALQAGEKVVWIGEQHLVLRYLRYLEGWSSARLKDAI